MLCHISSNKSPSYFAEHIINIYIYVPLFHNAKADFQLNLWTWSGTSKSHANDLKASCGSPWWWRQAEFLRWVIGKWQKLKGVFNLKNCVKLSVTAMEHFSRRKGKTRSHRLLVASWNDALVQRFWPNQCAIRHSILASWLLVQETPACLSLVLVGGLITWKQCRLTPSKCRSTSQKKVMRICGSWISCLTPARSY